MLYAQCTMLNTFCSWLLVLGSMLYALCSKLFVLCSLLYAKTISEHKDACNKIRHSS